MDTLNTIFSRKSIRTYTGEPVSPEQEALILKAANAAPVGMGQYDTVHLTIIKNKELLSEIDSTAAALMKRPDSHPLYGTPELIVVSVKFNPS
ncbi:MAG: nitroreductase family protein, partial [Lachnospiraceae bacterium]|nr:nitroreductase family protein [Lachnospiraceae bacterium]